MISFILSLLLVVSPIWPLGENPLVGDPYLIVNTSKNQMVFITDGEVKQQFQIAVGKKGYETPEGEFTIVVKAINPYYRKADIQGGDEKNPLGSRWIGFDADGTDGREYGLHGTNEPWSIGYRVTRGCVRLANSDIEVLFDEIPIGTKVLITSSSQSFEELGEAHGAIGQN